jgi:hypothetical protein
MGIFEKLIGADGRKELQGVVDSVCSRILLQVLTPLSEGKDLGEVERSKRGDT